MIENSKLGLNIIPSSMINNIPREQKRPLLGLNIIVGGGEEKELERCLKSIQGPLFDEIVVTVTTEDKEVKAVAEKYATKIPYFKWTNNFSEARNYSFKHNTSVFVMWLDSDDVVKPSEYEKLLKLKATLLQRDPDIVLMDYVYCHDDQDKPVLVLPRERLVRNCEKIKWHDPIHEYLNMDNSFKIERVPIAIDHYRIKPFDPKRNIELLKKEYDKGNSSDRIQFYYGKELADTNNWTEALPILEKFVATGVGFRDNLTVACIRLAHYYLSNNNKESAKTYALHGIRFNDTYAENYVTLGTIYEETGDTEEAIKYFKEAMTKQLVGGMSQIVDYYGFIPASKLAHVYMNLRKPQEALKYIEIAANLKPEFQQAQEFKKVILNECERTKAGNTLQEPDVKKIAEFLDGLKLTMSVSSNNYDYADLRIIKKRELEVVWLIPALDLSNPSIRIRRFNVHEEMVRQGIKSRLIVGYQNKNIYEQRNEIGEASVVIFTTYGKPELELMRLLKPLGKRIVFDHCEGLFGYPLENESMQEADIIACCSTKLAEMTNEHGFLHTVVLKDAVEYSQFETEHQYKRDWE